jgi:hypothetical protein
MSDIEVINNDKFLVKIQDNKNNTTQVINKVITLDQTNETFTQIANTIKVNSNIPYTFKITNSMCQIFAEEEIIIKGYIFNTTTTVTKIVYELSLIKIDENLYFLNEKCECENCECEKCECENCECENLDKSTQYILHNGIDNETQTNFEETELETIYEMYEGPEVYEGPHLFEMASQEVPDLESVSDFGEFQSANNFVEINLNEHQNVAYTNLPYTDNYNRGSYFNNYNNVIVPEYNPPVYEYPTQTYPSYPTYLNQIQGSQVPSYCTQANSWSPELMNELSYRLNLPNSGLNSNHFSKL